MRRRSRAAARALPQQPDTATGQICDLVVTVIGQSDGDVVDAALILDVFNDQVARVRAAVTC